MAFRNVYANFIPFRLFSSKHNKWKTVNLKTACSLSVTFTMAPSLPLPLKNQIHQPARASTPRLREEEKNACDGRQENKNTKKMIARSWGKHDGMLQARF